MTQATELTIDDAPAELRVSIQKYFPESEWNNAARVAYLESNWNAFAIADTTAPNIPCGSPIRVDNGITVVAERSVGYFQVNTCNFPAWEWARFYNADHNAGTAHMLWDARGWEPWYFSAKTLGLISGLTRVRRRRKV